MLFLRFVLYLSSFVGVLRNEIPGAALELFQLKVKQFSLGILKSSTKHEYHAFTLNCFMISCTFLIIFHAGSRSLGSMNLRNSSFEGKTAGLAYFSRLFFVSYDYNYSNHLLLISSLYLVQNGYYGCLHLLYFSVVCEVSLLCTYQLF